MVHIAYYTELNLHICNCAQKRRICRENSRYTPDDKFLWAFLPSPKGCDLLPPAILFHKILHKMFTNAGKMRKQQHKMVLDRSASSTPSLASLSATRLTCLQTLAGFNHPAIQPQYIAVPVSVDMMLRLR